LAAAAPFKPSSLKPGGVRSSKIGSGAVGEAHFSPRDAQGGRADALILKELKVPFVDDARP